MRLGVKNSLGLLAGYCLLLLAFGFGIHEWLGSVEERLNADTVRLIAREHANLVFERSLETLQFPDADSRRRLRERIQDLTQLSELVSSLSVVDRAGQVV